MSKHKELADRIALLASETSDFQGGQRVLDHSSATKSILDEIDTALLGAALTFVAGEAHMTLNVSGRRLLSVSSAPEGLFEAGLGEALSSETPAHCKAAASLVAAFGRIATGEGVLLVGSDALDDAIAHVSGSVSASRLAEELGLDQPQLGEEGGAEALLARMGDRVTAAIHVKGHQIAGTLGESSALVSLKLFLTTQLGVYLKQTRALDPTPEGPELRLIADAVEPGESLGLMTFETDTILFAFESSKFFEMQGLLVST